jgi:hypothetical protein
MAQLLSNLPNGALVKFGKHQVGSESSQPIIWMIVDKNHNGYPANSVSLITQKIIDYRAYDSNETHEQTETTIEGNVNYGLSNIHQWLNSSASAGTWYKPSHSEDNPPNNDYTRYNTGYDTRPGFLYHFTPTERNALLPTTIKTQISNTFGSITTKVFLPSLWETIGTHSVPDDSSRFAYFVGSSSVCASTSQAYTNTSSTNKPSAVTANWMYLTRSTYGGYTYSVDNNGSSTNALPNDGSKGVRPVINLSASTKVTDTADADGCYNLLTQNTPVISGSNSNLGVKTGDFTQTYTVSDADNEAVTVTEYIDNMKVRSYVATLGATNTFAVTDKTWLKLSNGAHTLKITATDGFDEVTRTFTFTKSVTTLVVQRTTPLDSSTQPKSILVTVVKVIPKDAIFKVEACNNGYDASPTWEDITTRVVQGRIYDFTNTTKTADKWGVNIRVTVDRNGSEGACYITEIGGNFE